MDLHLGRQTRPHADLDVGCFRGDLPQLRSDMDGWELYAAREGTLARLGRGEEPTADTNSVWCHPAGAAEWWLELLLDDRDGAEWVFRRCRSVRWPTSELTLGSQDGTKYLRPEIQLLYKAKAPRAKDEADLRALLPALDATQRAWLERALAQWQPENAWLSVLRRAV